MLKFLWNVIVAFIEAFIVIFLVGVVGYLFGSIVLTAKYGQDSDRIRARTKTRIGLSSIWLLLAVVGFFTGDPLVISVMLLGSVIAMIVLAKEWKKISGQIEASQEAEKQEKIELEKMEKKTDDRYNSFISMIQSLANSDKRAEARKEIEKIKNSSNEARRKATQKAIKKIGEFEQPTRAPNEPIGIDKDGSFYY